MCKKPYAAPSSTCLQHITNAICAASELEGTQAGGGGGKTEAPSRHLYL